MSTRQAKSVDLDIYASVMKDIIAWDPDLQHHLDLDLVRMKQRIDMVGLHQFLMIDLPEAGKQLDQSLSAGFLVPREGSLLFDPYHDSFFNCLLWKIFDFQDGYYADGRIGLQSEIDPNSIFFLRQLFYMAKKVKVQCPVEAVEQAAQEFCLIEAELREPSLSWFTPEWTEEGTFKSKSDELKSLSFCDAWLDLDFERQTDIHNLAILDSVARVVVNGYPEFDPLSLRPKHGPGAVSDGSIRSTSFDKFKFPTWPEYLERVFPYSYYGQVREDLHREEDTIYEPASSLACSKLLAVPKTYSGPRLIASEPTGNQFLQQGVGRWMKDELPSCLKPCIDFRSQDPSREMCVKASISGELSTVDLKSASDRLSCFTVERLFASRPDILLGLMAVRTPDIDISGISSDDTIEEFGEILTLRKYAPQGSGVTFPLQTVCYAIVAITAVIITESLESGREIASVKRNIRSSRIKRAARKVRVFGDDIIIPNSAVPVLEELLKCLQFVVNQTKTHRTGHFRESCGMDAYNGYDVTPVYLSALTFNMSRASRESMSRAKRLSPEMIRGMKPSQLSSWIDVSNNAYRAGLLNLAECMDDSIPALMRKYLPAWQMELGCLTRICQSGSVTDLSAKFSGDVQSWHVRGITSSDKSKMAKRDGYDALLAWFYYAEEMKQSECQLSFLAPRKSSATSRLVQPQDRLILGWVPVAR